MLDIPLTPPPSRDKRLYDTDLTDMFSRAANCETVLPPNVDVCNTGTLLTRRREGQFMGEGIKIQTGRFEPKSRLKCRTMVQAVEEMHR
jgi:hypothetical protein